MAVDVQEFYTPGLFFWTKPTGTTEVTVYLVGGGGSGAYGYTDTAAGGGGGGGAMIVKVPVSYLEDDDYAGRVGGGGSTHGATFDQLSGEATTFSGHFLAYGGYHGLMDPRLGGPYYSEFPELIVSAGNGQDGTAPAGSLGGTGGAHGTISTNNYITAAMGHGGDGAALWPGPGFPQTYGQNGAAGAVVVVTTISADHYLRMTQRDDGLGIARSPRLAGASSNASTSLQRGKPPRLGSSNTYR